jgi:hypothetical protein
MDCEQCGRTCPRGVLRDGICSECRDMIRRNEERDALRADLAQAQARADALAIENAELRAGLLVELADAIANVRRLTNRMPAEVVDSYLHSPRLERLRALLAADPAQRGAELIAAIDDVIRANRYMHAKGVWKESDLERILEAVNTLSRLRGGRAPDGGA